MWPAYAALAGAELAGGFLGSHATREANRKNAELQREFAQNGIRWRVADAKAAGIHPLYALGANVVNASPSYVGDTSLPSALSGMGQNVSRAIHATRTRNERLDALDKVQLERAQTELAIAKVDLASKQRALNQVGPSFPSGSEIDASLPGQGDAVINDPFRRTRPEPDARYESVGWYPDREYLYTGTGLFPVIPKDVSESFEQDPVGGVMWRFRNSIAPIFTRGRPPSLNKLPKGAIGWDYIPWRFEYVPLYPGDIPWRERARRGFLKGAGSR